MAAREIKGLGEEYYQRYVGIVLAVNGIRATRREWLVLSKFVEIYAEHRYHSEPLEYMFCAYARERVASALGMNPSGVSTMLNRLVGLGALDKNPKTKLYSVDPIYIPDYSKQEFRIILWREEGSY